MKKMNKMKKMGKMEHIKTTIFAEIVSQSQRKEKADILRWNSVILHVTFYYKILKNAFMMNSFKVTICHEKSYKCLRREAVLCGT